MKIYKSILYTILLVIIWFIVELLVLLPIKYFTEDTISSQLAILLNIIAAIIAYLSVFFLFDVPRTIEKSLFKFKPINYKLLAPLFVLLIGMFLFDRLLWDLFNGILTEEKAFKNVFKPQNFLNLTFALQCLSTVVISPIFEELFFRKLLFNQLLKRYSLMISVLISSVLFSLIHIQTPHNLLATFFGGFLFALVFNKTKNILYPIILHMGFNFIVLFFGIEIAQFYGSLHYNALYYILAFVGLLLIYISFKWLNEAKS